jgi:hypothetical protein
VEEGEQKDDGIQQQGSPPAVAETVPCVGDGKGTKKRTRMTELQKLQSGSEQPKKPRVVKPTGTKPAKEKAGKGGEEIKKARTEKM